MSVPEMNNNIAAELGWSGIPMEAARYIANYIAQLENNIATLAARVKDLESAARNSGPHLARVEKREVHLQGAAKCGRP